MGLVKPFTARVMADITPREDKIDREYTSRVFNLQSKIQLRDLIVDYEEFLPQGLQIFQKCSDREFSELMSQIKRFHERVIKKQPLPAEPTEAIMFITPPMLTIPREFALSMGYEMKKYITWGMGFLRLKNEGMIKKLQLAQETMYQRIIEIKDYVNETMDTKSSLTESDLKTVIPANGNSVGTNTEN